MKLREYLRLPVIIGPLPNIILNGQIIDAVPVMNDFNWIVNQVNANVPALIPTVTIFSTYVPAAAVGGTGNAITLTPTPALGAYAEGISYRFKAIAANTGATTVNVSGLGLRQIFNGFGGQLTGGEITTGGEYDICDNGTAYVLVNSSQGNGLLTWTPGIAFGGLSVGVTYGTQSGIYTKINNMVWFWFQMQLTNKGSSAGTLTITGLPFTINGSLPHAVANDMPMQFDMLGGATSLPAGSIIKLILNQGTTTMGIQTYSIVGFTRIAYGQLDVNNNTLFTGSGFYPV